MDIRHLSKNELKALFLKINDQYLKIIDAPIATYIDTPQFLIVRNQLHEVLNELEKRRHEDPYIIHSQSPPGYDPDAWANLSNSTEI
jgi:hypothetical protein